MASIVSRPAEYTLTLTQEDVDNLRSILRGYIDPSSYSTKQSRAGEVAWLVDAVWDESVWDTPWLYSWEGGDD